MTVTMVAIDLWSPAILTTFTEDLLTVTRKTLPKIVNRENKIGPKPTEDKLTTTSRK